MNIVEMIPGLDDEALKTVRINATRLTTNGTPKQKEQALAALTLLDEEELRREAAGPRKKPAKAAKTSDTGAVAPKRRAPRKEKANS